MAVLEVCNLTKSFTRGIWSRRYHEVVKGISFSLQEGEILGFLGPNGAGKTTTIQMLLGTLLPTSGAIAYFGRDFLKESTHALQCIGYASGYDTLPGRLTVYENLDIFGRLYGLATAERHERITYLLKIVGMSDMKNSKVSRLSAGQATRAMLAKAFLSRPRIVLLDEPTASLDPDIAATIRQFIAFQRREHGVSILITSHNMYEVTALCDRVIMLKNGSIVASDTPQGLARSISRVRLHITVEAQHDALAGYVQERMLVHSMNNNRMTIEIDEQEVALFLRGLAQRDVVYTQISIDTPTLEDYFLQIAQEKGSS